MLLKHGMSQPKLLGFHEFMILPCPEDIIYPMASGFYNFFASFLGCFLSTWVSLFSSLKLTVSLY